MSKHYKTFKVSSGNKTVVFIIFLAIVLYSFFHYQGQETPVLTEHQVTIDKKVKLNEKYYIERWSKNNQGVTEYSLPDRTRVDVMTADYAVEVDFASKWYQAIGQSLHYALLTKKDPGIVLIAKTDKDKKYLERLVAVIQEYDLPITVWQMTDNTESVVYRSIQKRE